MSFIRDAQGHRLYCTRDEVRLFLNACLRHKTDLRLFCHVLAYTGCRPSEALALTPERIDRELQALTFETLKKRRKGQYRTVPIPTDLVRELADFALHKKPTERLWTWGRSTAWGKVKAVFDAAEIHGAHATAKGLRHGFAIISMDDGDAPINMVQKWLGHASIRTTAIYANALQSEERHFAEGYWEALMGQ